MVAINEVELEIFWRRFAIISAQLLAEVVVRRTGNSAESNKLVVALIGTVLKKVWLNSILVYVIIMQLNFSFRAICKMHFQRRFNAYRRLCLRCAVLLRSLLPMMIWLQS